MRAAIYARRSTEEHQAESLETQVDGARRMCAARGWTVVATFLDDGVSRAEFKRRRGLIALLNAASAGAFDVVVTRDETRVGGDMIRTGLVIQDLVDHGARLFYYATGEEVRIDDATARFLVAAKNFSSELEREKIASRTREHLERKARRGFVAGGVVFGYRNVRSAEGVRREVDPGQAELVRETFRRYAAGEGLRAIAKDFNGRRVPPPRAGRRGTGSWAPSSLREMVRRPLYIGLVEWGARHKLYRGGTKTRTAEHAHELVAVELPELRIVDEATWTAVKLRTARKGAMRAKGAAPRHLLSGIARCAECGGPIHVARMKVSYDNVPAYGCGWHRDRGKTVCTNSLRRPVESVNAAVIEWIRAHVLREEVVVEVLRELRVHLQERAKTVETDLPKLEGEARALRAEVDRLAVAIATSATKSGALVRALDEREARLRDLDARIRAMRTTPAAISLEVRRMERTARARLAELRELFGRHPAEARKALEALAEEGLKVSPVETPEGRRYQISGVMALDRMISTEGVPSGM